MDSGEVRLLREPDRAILIDESLDTAAIVFGRRNMPLPQAPYPLTPEDVYLKIGNEVGWVGFPVLSPNYLCFFTGKISAYLSEQNAYLVDGVAINGVSGGPAFTREPEGTLTIIGVVSAYVPNRATGETLPGLCLISDVLQLQGVVRTFVSLDEAKEKEQQMPPNPESPRDDDSAGT